MSKISFQFVSVEKALKLPNSPGKAKSRIHLYDGPWDKVKGDKYAIAAEKLKTQSNGQAPKLGCLDKKFYFLHKVGDVWYKINKNSLKKRLGLTSAELKSMIGSDGITKDLFLQIIQQKSPPSKKGKGSQPPKPEAKKTQEEEPAPLPPPANPATTSAAPKSPPLIASAQPPEPEEPKPLESPRQSSPSPAADPHPQAAEPPPAGVVESGGQVIPAPAQESEPEPEYTVEIVEEDSGPIPTHPYLLDLQIDFQSSLHQDAFDNSENGALMVSIVPLSEYFKNGPLKKMYVGILQQFTNEPIAQKVKSRIDELGKVIKLGERLQLLNLPDRPKIGDIQKKWSESPLKFLLMLDEEIVHLKIYKFAKLDNFMLFDTIGNRIADVSTRFKPNLPAQLDIQAILKLPITQLSHLKAGDLTKFSKILPPIVYVLASPAEVNKIDFQKLSLDQLKMIGLSEKHVQALSIAQINVLAPNIKVEYLTETQVLGLNLSRFEDKKKVFDKLFPTGYNSQGMKLIPKQNIDWIYANQALFSHHWEYLNDDQAAALDLSKIDEAKRKEVFNQVFYATYSSDSKAKVRIPKLSLDQIYAYQKYFSDQHWESLSGDQAVKLDFSKIDKRKDVFNKVFTTSYSDSTSNKRIPKLSLDQIYTCQEYFSDEHWKCLTYPQALGLDFTKIDKKKEVFDKVFTTNYSDSPGRVRIPKLSVDQIYVCQEWFSDDQWEYLSDAQVKDLDFSKMREKNVKKKMIEKVFSTSWSDNKAKKRIPQLSVDQIYACQKFFGTDQWECLSDDQAIGLDFTKIVEKQDVFDKVFKTSYLNNKAKTSIPKLSLQFIYDNQPLFSDDRWKYLSDDQKKRLDKSKIKRTL